MTDSIVNMFRSMTLNQRTEIIRTLSSLNTDEDGALVAGGEDFSTEDSNKDIQHSESDSENFQVIKE